MPSSARHTECKVEKVHGTGYLACNGWVQLTLSG